MYEFACKKDIKLKEIHLKAEDITRFAALFVADKNNFLSDNFRELYIHAREIKKIAETEDFYISFSFMPASEKINESCLITDGYFLKYEKNKERLDHAIHNENVCSYLELKKEYADWIITTAFYSALQFVSYKIFPLKFKA
ncbi:MAG: hypothetical protein WKG06_39235 [Segetibacter sp.]